MPIQSATAVTLDEVCTRLDAVQYIPAMRRLVPTDSDMEDIRTYLGGDGLDGLSPIADRRFDRVDNKYREGRYNSAAFPAFYMGRTEEAARAEILHYHPIEKLRAFASVRLPLHFGFTEWRVAGPAEDIVPAAATEPRLTAEDKSYCQLVGADIRLRADAVVFPSARLNGGVNIAAFRRNRVEGLRRGRDIRLDVTQLGTITFLD
jgi:hypothetical protein